MRALLILVALTCPPSPARATPVVGVGWGGSYSGSAALTHRLLQLGPDLTVTVLSGYPQVTGFPGDQTTVGFRFENAGRQRDVRIELRDQCSAVHHVVVPEEERRSIFLYLPPTRADSVAAVLTSGPHQAEVLVSVTHARDSYTRAFATLGGYAGRVPGGWLSMGAIDSYMPDDWRGLSGFTAIGVHHEHLLAYDDWRPILADWVAMGGVLLVETPGWMQHNKMFGELPLERHASVEVGDDIAFVVHSGLGAIAYLHPRTARLIQDHPLYSLGLTTPHVSAHNDRSSAVAEFIARSLREVITPPYGGLLAILIAFALLIGPAGWIYWMRFRRRPFAYLVSTIAGSAVFCGAVIATNILSEGRIPIGTARSVRLVDHRANVELDFEEAAVWPPLRINNDLAAPVDASLFVATPYSSVQEVDCSIEIQQRTQRHRDVLPVRVGRLVGMRRLAKPRGRLTVATADASVQAENHLGEDLERLYIWHGKSLYRFGPLARGERGTGARVDAGELPEVPGGFVTGPAAMVLAELVAGDRGKRRFVAEIARADSTSPLLAAGMREVDSTEPSSHFIAGLY